MSIIEVNKEKLAKRFEKRLKRAIRFLEKSGMWKSMLVDFKTILEDRLFFTMIIEDNCNGYDGFYNNIYTKRNDPKSPYSKLQWLTLIDNLLNMEKPWKTPRWDYWQATEKNKVQEAVANKKEYATKWRNGYDNSIEISPRESEGLCGWYSEEYRNTGNGHYYFLLDDKHALFGEDD